MYSKAFEKGMRKNLKDCLHRTPRDIISDSKMTDEQRCYWEECIKAGYISGGIHNDRTADGVIHILIANPSVTRSGREFLDNRNPYTSAKFALIISLVSGLFQLLLNWDKIYSNFNAIISIIR